MGKQEQLIEYIVQDIVDMFSSDQDIEYDEAMNKFYNSKVFEKLQDKETGLYMESHIYKTLDFCLNNTSKIYLIFKKVIHIF